LGCGGGGFGVCGGAMLKYKHSAKPDLFYQQLEAEQTAGPKLDMFARVRRDGWDVYGDQVSGSITIRENA
jgi:N6-adenosine-specific RNA methylase IME4